MRGNWRSHSSLALTASFYILWTPRCTICCISFFMFHVQISASRFVSWAIKLCDAYIVLHSTFHELKTTLKSNDYWVCGVIDEFSIENMGIYHQIARGYFIRFTLISSGLWQIKERTKRFMKVWIGLGDQQFVEIDRNLKHDFLKFLHFFSLVITKQMLFLSVCACACVPHALFYYRIRGDLNATVRNNQKNLNSNVFKSGGSCWCHCEKKN